MFVDELFEDWVISKWSQEVNRICWSSDFHRWIVRRLSDFQVISRRESYMLVKWGESYAGQVIFTDELYADWVISKWSQDVNRICWSSEVNRMLVKWFSYTNCTQIEWFPSDCERWIVCWSSDLHRWIVHRLSDFQVTLRGELYAGQVIRRLIDFQVISRGESYTDQVTFIDKLYADCYWVISRAKSYAHQVIPTAKSHAHQQISTPGFYKVKMDKIWKWQ